MNTPCSFVYCLGLESTKDQTDLQHSIYDLGERQDNLERRLGVLAQIVCERLGPDGDANREVR